MPASVKGIPQLNARLEAIKPNPELMRNLGLTAIAEQKKLAAVDTGNMRRTIGLGSITATMVETVVTASYAIWVEFGTKAHDIVPRFKKALRWKPKGAARPVFAKRVRHPGTRAQPFMVPGAKRAVEEVGFKDVIYREWNGAA